MGNDNLKNERRNLRSNQIGRSPLSSPLVASSSSNIWEKIETRLNNLTITLTDTILSTLRKELSEITKTFDTRINEMEANFNSRIKSLEKDFNGKCEMTNKFMLDCETKLAQIMETKQNNTESITTQIDALARKSIAGDFVLHGIPFSENENLGEIFNKFCSTLGIDLLRPHYILRTKPKNILSHSAIIVRLPHENDKNYVLRKVSEFYKSTSRLVTLHDLGFVNKNSFVRVYECLTKLNHAVFRKANDMRKRKQVNSVYTRYGRVFVREDADKKPICVTSIAQLQSTFPVHANGFKMEKAHNANNLSPSVADNVDVVRNVASVSDVDGVAAAGVVDGVADVGRVAGFIIDNDVSKFIVD